MSVAALARLRSISIIEILYLPLLLVPSASALLVISLLSPVFWLVLMALYVVLMLVGGSLISALFTLIRRPGTRLLPPWCAKIDAALLAHGLTQGHEIALRIRSARLEDLAVGAFVHATFRAKIVASGGLLVQLMRGSPSAQAIVAHEYAHIRHFDRLYLMILLVYAANLILSPIYFLQLAGYSESIYDIGEVIIWWLFNLATTTLIVSQISRRRELAADFAAALMVGGKAYLDFLDLATGRHAKRTAGFFHPSVEQRKEALITMRVGRPNGLLVMVYCLSLASYLLQAMASTDEIAVATGLAQGVYCALGICFEQFRRSIPSEIS